MIYLVTTAQTVYETYCVEAPDEESARANVSDSATRASLESYESGTDGGDEIVIDVREQS